ncbi:hypothetical protein ACFP76_07900 [Paracoccus aerius]|uniref:hypothetical protein n=1 Tax=Paracoccus aerius TaxID=1915382 RepID=UPI003615BC89
MVIKTLSSDLRGTLKVQGVLLHVCPSLIFTWAPEGVEFTTSVSFDPRLIVAHPATDKMAQARKVGLNITSLIMKVIVQSHEGCKRSSTT